MLRSLFILFLLVPLIEIYFLIQLGEEVGAGWTIFLVLATAFIGAGLLRMQGLSTMQRAQVSITQGQLPALAMLEGVALLISGGLLLTPGFFTDLAGFLLLIPLLRQALIKRLIEKAQFSGYSSPQHNEKPNIIEGELVNEDDERHLR